MSTGWPPFRYRFSTTLQSGTVFCQKEKKKVDYGSTYTEGAILVSSQT